MSVFKIISETCDYWRLKRIQRALEEQRLTIPLIANLSHLTYTTESFARESVSLYVNTDEEYEPILTVRCYHGTALISIRIDPLTPHPDQPINDPLLADTFDAITGIIPEGKLVGIKLSSGVLACYYVVGLRHPGVSSVGALFDRVRFYFTSTMAQTYYRDYQDKFLATQEAAIQDN